MKTFFDSDNIQNILQKKRCPYLKITKTPSQNGYQLDEHTLHLPLEKVESLLDWLQINLISYLNQKKTVVVSDLSNEPMLIDDKFIRNLHSPKHAKLYLFDDKGTLAIIDNRTQMAWLEPSRQQTQTNQSFDFTFAKTSDFTKVSRKKNYYLQDWLWNLIWHSKKLWKSSYRR